jgi:hypothetical protein
MANPIFGPNFFTASKNPKNTKLGTKKNQKKIKKIVMG